MDRIGRPNEGRGRVAAHGACSPGFVRILLPSQTGWILLCVAPIAGFQHHGGMDPRVMGKLRKGIRLEPTREPENPHDSWAIALRTRRGVRIGYVPRSVNQPIARMMDQGMRIGVAIRRVDHRAAPWERVRIVVWLEIPAGLFVSEN